MIKLEKLEDAAKAALDAYVLVQDLEMTRIEYQVYEKESGMTVAWADDIKDALHYLSIYNQDFPHGLYKVTFKEITNG